MSQPPVRAALLLGLGLAWLSLPDVGPDPVPAPRPEPVPAGVAGLLYGARLDLNRAAADHLEVLPGIGPARARAIVAARSGRPFCRVDELLRVPGIGPHTLGRVSAQVSVPPGVCPPR